MGALPYCIPLPRKALIFVRIKVLSPLIINQFGAACHLENEKNKTRIKNQTEIKTRLTFVTNVISFKYSCVNVAKNYVILVSIEYL